MICKTLLSPAQYSKPLAGHAEGRRLYTTKHSECYVVCCLKSFTFKKTTNHLSYVALSSSLSSTIVTQSYKLVIVTAMTQIH